MHMLLELKKNSFRGIKQFKVLAASVKESRKYGHTGLMQGSGIKLFSIDSESNRGCSLLFALVHHNSCERDLNKKGLVLMGKILHDSQK